MNLLHLIYDNFQTGLATGLAAVIVYLCFSTWGRWQD